MILRYDMNTEEYLFVLSKKEFAQLSEGNQLQKVSGDKNNLKVIYTLDCSVGKPVFKCPNCGKFYLLENAYSDELRLERICENCFNQRFAEAESKKDTQWFLKNYDRKTLVTQYKEKWLLGLGIFTKEEYEEIKNG